MCLQTVRWMQFGTLKCFLKPREAKAVFLTELLPGSTWCQAGLFVSRAACAQLADNCMCMRCSKEAPGKPRTRVRIICCVRLRLPCSGVVCRGSTPPPSPCNSSVIRKGLSGQFTLLLTLEASLPLKRDLLALDEETFFKAKAEVFTEFIDKIPPLWAQTMVEHHLKISFKSPFSS